MPSQPTLLLAQNSVCYGTPRARCHASTIPNEGMHFGTFQALFLGKRFRGYSNDFCWSGRVTRCLRLGSNLMDVILKVPDCRIRRSPELYVFDSYTSVRFFVERLDGGEWSRVSCHYSADSALSQFLQLVLDKRSASGVRDLEGEVREADAAKRNP